MLLLQPPMSASELALEKANAEIIALQESVASLDRKLTQLSVSSTSPAKTQAQRSQTAFDALTGPSMPRSRSTATLDRLNAQSTVESEELAMGTTRVVMHQIVLPSDSDTLGICFGGQVVLASTLLPWIVKRRDSNTVSMFLRSGAWLGRHLCRFSCKDSGSWSLRHCQRRCSTFPQALQSGQSMPSAKTIP